MTDQWKVHIEALADLYYYGKESQRAAYIEGATEFAEILSEETLDHVKLYQMTLRMVHSFEHFIKKIEETTDISSHHLFQRCKLSIENYYKITRKK